MKLTDLKVFAVGAAFLSAQALLLATPALYEIDWARRSSVVPRYASRTAARICEIVHVHDVEQQPEASWMELKTYRVCSLDEAVALLESRPGETWLVRLHSGSPR